MLSEQPPRPTEEQMSQLEASWQSQRGSTPDYVPQGVMREVCIVGDFLQMKLEEAGAPVGYLSHRASQLGRLCVGRDPWEAFDKIWPHCVKDLNELTARKEWADVPVPQDVPEGTELLGMWYDSVKAIRDSKGVYPHQLLLRDANGDLAMHALALTGMQAFEYATKLMKTKPQELVFGVDMVTVPGQGLELADFLVVIWYVGGKLFTGVLEYAKAVGDPPAGQEGHEFRDINWNNNYWNHSLRTDILPAMEKALR